MKISETITGRRAPEAVRGGGNAPDNSSTISYEQTGEFLSGAVAERNRTVFKKAMLFSAQARQNGIDASHAQQSARSQVPARPTALANSNTQRRPMADSRTEKRRDPSAPAPTAMMATAVQGEGDETGLLTGMLQQQREVLEQYLKLLDMGEGQTDELLQRHDGSVQEGKELAARMQRPEQPKAMREFRAIYHDKHQLEPPSAQQIVSALAAKFSSKDQFFMSLDNLRLMTGTRMGLARGAGLGAMSCEAYAEGAAFHLIQSTFKIAGRLRAGFDNAVSQIVEPVGEDDEQEDRGRRRGHQEDGAEEEEENPEKRLEKGDEEVMKKDGGHADSR